MCTGRNSTSSSTGGGAPRARDEPVPDAPDPRDLVALLYRADWTRLSLSAGMHEVSDWALRTTMHMPTPPWFPTLTGDLPSGERASDVHRARLRVAPGGRYRVDILPVEAEDENAGDHDRVLRCHYGTRPGMPPPYPELLWPSPVLNAFSLELAGCCTEHGHSDPHNMMSCSDKTRAQSW